MDRKAVITKLAKCQYNPIQDVTALEAFSDEGLTALEEHCSNQSDTFKAMEDELNDVKDELKTAQATIGEKDKTLRAAEAEVRKAKKTLTEDEWMAQAPPSIKALVERQKKQDDEKRDDLVGVLKTAQKEYSEDELKAMPLEQLERFSKLLKIEQSNVDYSGARPVRRAAEGQENDVYLNPPDPYQEALKRQRAKTN